jgi:hypothetical protein
MFFYLLKHLIIVSNQNLPTGLSNIDFLYKGLLNFNMNRPLLRRSAKREPWQEPDFRPVPTERRDPDYSPQLDNRFQTQVGRGIMNLLQNEVDALLPRDHFLHGARRAAESVILQGQFEPSRMTATPESIEEARSLTINTAKEYVQRMLGESGNPALLATPWAAAYYVLTGEKCWSEEEADRMKEDLGSMIDYGLEKGKFRVVASEASNYRLIFGEERWSEEQRRAMVEATEEHMKMFIALAFNTKPFQDPPLVGLSSNAAAIRILEAQTITPVKDDPTRGIEIIDSLEGYRPDIW